MSFFDIIIIGAGIAGSRTARILSEKGFSVAILEKNKIPGKGDVCGGLLSQKWFDFSIGDKNLIQNIITSTEFIFPWGKYEDHSKLLTVKRSDLDPALAKLAEHSGAKIFCVRATKPFFESSYVIVECIDNNDNTVKRFKGYCCIFADGPFSIAHKHTSFSVNRSKEKWGFAAVAQLYGSFADINTAQIYFDNKLVPWGYAWIFPYKKQLNVGVGTTISLVKKGVNVGELLNFFMMNYEPLKSLVNVSRVDKYRGGLIPMWPVRQFSNKMMAVVGDAAGTVSPIFGAGIDGALETAEILSEVVVNALKTKKNNQVNLLPYNKAIQTFIKKEIKPQQKLAKIVIFGMKFNRSFAIKLLSILAFGGVYTRFQKLKILFFPLLGIPRKTIADIKHQ